MTSLYPPPMVLEAEQPFLEDEALSKSLGSSGQLLPSHTPSDGFCSWHFSLQGDSHASDLTTSCTIALGVITQNNTKGYSTAELESRLLPGYLMAQGANEDCRIRNRVLFEILAEIS